ncbi:hypothetical protein U9M48_026228 [Paspalum notatum var. saurae]|uniref:DUF1618 domain-containing protein n=1 Tax=Paspalum notatum var. saurae TaxID=547442 RepID=A0AAQ3TRY5_PASNO
MAAPASASAAAPSCDWEEVLLDDCALIGDERNHTTGASFTRNDESILASFWRERPPVLSRLYVWSLDLDASAFSEPPRILRMEEGLILFRVAINCRLPCILNDECDYFVYHVDSARLDSLPPHPSAVTLSDDAVGLLPRGSGSYTVAALTSRRSVFTLHLLHSGIGKRWTSVEVSLTAPQSKFPLIHKTSTVITLGGEGGTMGWVDLWRGILLCDVLSPNPELRGVPVPLPTKILLPYDQAKIEPPQRLYRGIAFIKEKGCLRFVDLDVTYQFLSDQDEETGFISFRFDAWTITTWTNFNLTSSFDDWKQEHSPVHADTIMFNEKMRKQLLLCQLLQPKAPPQDNNVTINPERKLQNLWVSQPTPSIEGSKVFLIARAKFMYPEAHVLVVDMAIGELQGVSDYATGRKLGLELTCIHGGVSKRAA